MSLPKVIPFFTKRCEWLTERMGVIAAGVVVAMTLLVCVEVLARRLLHFSILITYDAVAFGLSAVVFLGIAETHRAGMHLRVRVINSHFPASVRKLLDVIFSVLTLAYLSYILKFAIPLVITSYREKTLTVGAVQMLVWPAQILMPIGLSVFLILEFGYFLRQCGAMFTKEAETLPLDVLKSVEKHEGE